jgi:hypothetical protein
MMKTIMMVTVMMTMMVDDVDMIDTSTTTNSKEGTGGTQYRGRPSFDLYVGWMDALPELPSAMGMGI